MEILFDIKKAAIWKMAAPVEGDCSGHGSPADVGILTVPHSAVKEYFRITFLMFGR